MAVHMLQNPAVVPKILGLKAILLCCFLHHFAEDRQILYRAQTDRYTGALCLVDIVSAATMIACHELLGSQSFQIQKVAHSGLEQREILAAINVKAHILCKLFI